jgi:hypothetical protein
LGTTAPTVDPTPRHAPAIHSAGATVTAGATQSPKIIATGSRRRGDRTDVTLTAYGVRQFRRLLVDRRSAPLASAPDDH